MTKEPTAIEKAITRAIEGGWHKEAMENSEIRMAYDGIRYRPLLSAIDAPYAVFPLEKALLDPAFWQALGKAEGWGRQKRSHWATEKQYHFSYHARPEVENIGITSDAYGCSCSLSGTPVWDGPAWLYYWHGLIDALASGQSPEEYLASILKDTA